MVHVGYKRLFGRIIPTVLHLLIVACSENEFLRIGKWFFQFIPGINGGNRQLTNQYQNHDKRSCFHIGPIPSLQINVMSDRDKAPNTEEYISGISKDMPISIQSE